MKAKPEPDPSIEAAFDWVLEYLPRSDWEERRLSIESAISASFPEQCYENWSVLRRPEILRDQIAWYLFLVSASQHSPNLTEEAQAARILPVFKRIGEDLELIQKMPGIDSQVEKLIGPSKAHPDSVLFEILVALLWAKNGYDVEFLPVAPPEKRPDIRASNNSGEWFIETKRLAPTSQYSEQEKKMWLEMWNPLAHFFAQYSLSLVLDIVFHVELKELNPSELYEELRHKLPFVMSEGQLASDSRWDVRVFPVNFSKVKRHFEKNFVKASSRQMMELIGGSWDRTRHFSYVMSAKNVQIGTGVGFNNYVEDVAWASGAYWCCDAERAREAKARDIRNHLSDAIKQIPDNKPGVIHIGIETNDGEAVEMERYERILATTNKFDPGEKDLKWVFTHLFESYAPISNQWTMDESIYMFQGSRNPVPDPLKNYNVVLGHDIDGSDSVHWRKSPPQ